MQVFIIIVAVVLNCFTVQATLIDQEKISEPVIKVKQVIGFMDLPLEIKENIVLKLYPQDIYQFRRLNKQCALLSHRNIFWKNFCTAQGSCETDITSNEAALFNYRQLFMASYLYHRYEKSKSIRGLIDKESFNILVQAAYSGHKKAQQDIGSLLSNYKLCLSMDYIFWRHNLLPLPLHKKLIDNIAGPGFGNTIDLEIMFVHGVNMMRTIPPDIAGLYWMHRCAFQLGKKYLNILGQIYSLKLIRNTAYENIHENINLSEHSCKQIALYFYSMTCNLGSKKGKKHQMYLKKVFYG